MLRLPEPFANTPGLTRHELSRYDERGPAWAWSWLEIGEHVGTHFDAPIHWITGKDGEDVASVPAGRLVGPALVIDKSAEAAADPDWCLSIADVCAFEAEHGPLPEGGWLLLRTGWDARAHDQEAFLNADESGPHTPGVEAECARWLAHEKPIVGDRRGDRRHRRRRSGRLRPALSVHSYFLGAGKYGLTQLANLAELPPTGAVIVVAPLKLVEDGHADARARARLTRPPSGLNGTMELDDCAVCRHSEPFRVHTFHVLDQQIGLVPAAIARTLGVVDTARGREDAFPVQRPQLLDALTEVARIQAPRRPTRSSRSSRRASASRRWSRRRPRRRTAPRPRSPATRRPGAGVRPGTPIHVAVLAEAGGHVAELVVLVVRTVPAAGCARSRARTRTPRSRRTSTPRPAP